MILAEPGALDNAGLDRFRERQVATQNLTYYRHLVPTIFESFHMDAVDGPVDNDARMDYIYGKMTANFVNTAASGYRCGAQEKAPTTPSATESSTIESSTTESPSRFGAVAFTTLFVQMLTSRRLQTMPSITKATCSSWPPNATASRVSNSSDCRWVSSNKQNWC